MVTIACIIGWSLAFVAIAYALRLTLEYKKLKVDKDLLEIEIRQNELLLEQYIDKTQRLQKDIYGLSDNRCEECGRFLPHNQAGNLCEVCAWVKSGKL